MQEHKNIHPVATTSTNQPIIPYRDDSIDLTDILVTLIKRKNILFWSLLLSILAGLAFVMYRPSVYSYVTAIEIGSQMTDSGTPVFFEKAQTVKSKLDMAYIPQVLLSYAAAHPDSPGIKNYKINVSVPKQSELIVLTAKGRHEQSESILEIEQMILNALSKDHGRILSIIRSSIVKEKAEAEAELAHLRNNIVLDVEKKKLQAKLVEAQTDYQRINEPDFVKVKRIVLENKLNNAKSKLGLLGDKSKKLKADSISLKQAEKKMANKVEDITLQIQQSLKKRDQAIKNVNDPTQAMTLLMIDSEIQQSRQFLTNLEQRLYVDMADKLSEIQVLKKENQQKQVNLKAKINKIQLDLQNFDKVLDMEGAPALADIDKIKAELSGIEVDRDRNIQKQIQKIQDLNVQIDNLSPTRSVSPPMQSLKPQGMGRIKTLIIFVFLGIVVGVVLVVFFEMGAKARQRLRELET